MNTSNDPVDQDRRRLLGTATLGIAAASASGLFTSQAGATSEDDSIRPFRFEATDAQLADLRQRVAATRWPDQEQVPDSTQGVQLATAQQLAAIGRRSTTGASRGKDQRGSELVTEIDGLDIHFIHVPSQHEDALPVIITHGWPGSIVEQMKVIGPLTDPTAHGGTAADAFHVVIPSLPGYGFSAKPTEPGWNPPRIAKAWAELMQRLGYTKYIAQGGDWGNAVTEQMALQEPPGLIGIHTNMPATVPPDISKALAIGAPQPAGLAADEQHAWDSSSSSTANGLGYAVEMNNRPQTLYGIVDSPVGLAAWMIDHDARSQEMIARVFAGQPEGPLERRRPRQCHALLADQHRDLLGPPLLGQRPPSDRRLLRRARGQDPGRGERLPRRDLRRPGDLGEAGLPAAHPLQQAAEGRALRRLGTAGVLRRRAPDRVPADTPDPLRRPGAPTGAPAPMADHGATDVELHHEPDRSPERSIPPAGCSSARQR